MFDTLRSQKRRWRAYKARVRALPRAYRTATEAVERYLLVLGPADGDTAATMFEDLADLFERAALDSTPIRDIVGEDPVEFVLEFARNYAGGGWVSREQRRLVEAIETAESIQAGRPEQAS
jgi:DNA-binding ferritin-like protein (Dps family)